MPEITLSEKLAFLQSHLEPDEAVLLAQAVREGIRLMYRDKLVEAYLLGETSREAVLQEVGLEELHAIEYQRDTLQRDIEWGLYGE